MKTKLLEAYGHLGAALNQSIDSDDQIIMGHVRDAHTEIKKALDYPTYEDGLRDCAEQIKALKAEIAQRGPCEHCTEQHDVWTSEAVELITLASGESPDSDLQIDLMAALKIDIEELINEKNELKNRIAETCDLLAKHIQCPRCERLHTLYKSSTYRLECRNPGCGWKE